VVREVAGMNRQISTATHLCYFPHHTRGFAARSSPTAHTGHPKWEFFGVLRVSAAKILRAFRASMAIAC
jgi:hypothetical protein